MWVSLPPNGVQRKASAASCLSLGEAGHGCARSFWQTPSSGLPRRGRPHPPPNALSSWRRPIPLECPPGRIGIRAATAPPDRPCRSRSAPSLPAPQTGWTSTRRGRPGARPRSSADTSDMPQLRVLRQVGLRRAARRPGTRTCRLPVRGGGRGPRRRSSRGPGSPRSKPGVPARVGPGRPRGRRAGARVVRGARAGASRIAVSTCAPSASLQRPAPQPPRRRSGR